MVDDDGKNQHDAKEKPPLFVVRLGEGHEADYALCKRIGLIRGDTRLPSTGRTVSDLADAQALMSAKLSEDDLKGLKKLMFMAQSSENDLDDD